MTFKASVVSQATPTSNGNQTFTGSLGGDTPTSVLFMITRTGAVGTTTSNALWGFGFTDGTNEMSSAVRARNSVGTSATRRRSRNTSCIVLEVNNGSSIEFEAQFVSFAANSVTVNFITTGGTARMVTCILFSGTDGAFAGQYTVNATNNGTKAITDPGFQPDLIFGMGTRQVTPSSNGSWLYSLGFSTNDGVIKHGTMGTAVLDGKGTMQNYGMMQNNRHYVNLQTNSNNFDWSSEITSYDPTGFTLTTRDGNAGTQDCCYLALKLPAGVSANIVEIDTATSTGSNSITGFGFKPGLIMKMVTQNTAYNTVNAGGLAGTNAFSIFTASEEVTGYIADEDAVGSSDNETGLYGKAHYLTDDNGVLVQEADFVSMDSDGYTLNYTTAEVTVRKGFAIGIQDDSVVETQPGWSGWKKSKWINWGSLKGWGA